MGGDRYFTSVCRSLGLVGYGAGGLIHLPPRQFLAKKRLGSKLRAGVMLPCQAPGCTSPAQLGPSAGLK